MGNGPMSCCGSDSRKEEKTHNSPGENSYEGQENASKVLMEAKKNEPLKYGLDKIDAEYETGKYLAVGGTALVAKAHETPIKEFVSTLSPTGKAVTIVAGALVSYKGYEQAEKAGEKIKEGRLEAHISKFEDEKRDTE